MARPINKRKWLTPAMEAPSVQNPIGEEKKEPLPRCCNNCLHSHLMRSSPSNPVVSMCTLNNSRHVASTPQNGKCGYEESTDNGIIHEMIFL